ncbi:hypothetical protein SDC9_124304 [bioreactor metagenome]|uniref:Uncharacterized protein n=1 Tax=bioreactor metagenome TaxID=1076179 RepID=A0A645CK17_9ZZZZ
MGTAEEYRAEYAPEDRGQPAEHRSGGYRADDRTGAGDGRKVVSEDDRGMRGAVVHAVVHLLGRGDIFVADPIKIGHEPPVEYVAEYQQ